MRIIDIAGEMELDDDAVASTDDMNSIAGAVLSGSGFERWCAEGDELIEMGDTCEQILSKIRAWAQPGEIRGERIV